MMSLGRGLYLPQGHGWQTYKEALYIATHKIGKPWALWVFYVFHIVSLWELMTPGVGPFLTQGHGLKDLFRGSLHIATHKI